MGDWQRVPGSWLKRPGGGLAPEAIATRIAMAGAGAAACIVVAALVLPLHRGVMMAGAEVEGPSGSAELARRTEAAFDRRRLDAGRIAQLGEARLFRPGRAAPDAAPVVVETQSADATAQAPVPGADAPAAQSDRVSDGARIVRVESPEDVSKEIRDSFRELVLRAIHSDRSGHLVALIDYSAAGATGAPVRAREGDEFVEPKHKEQPWRVVVIDPQRDRVVVERQDRRLALALFGTGPADLSPVVIRPPSAPGAEPERVRVAQDGTLVAEQPADESIAELRNHVGAAEPGQKPITLEDLAELLQAMRDLERYAQQERIERERRSRSK